VIFKEALGVALNSSIRKEYYCIYFWKRPQRSWPNYNFFFWEWITITLEWCSSTWDRHYVCKLLCNSQCPGSEPSLDMTFRTRRQFRRHGRLCIPLYWTLHTNMQCYQQPARSVVVHVHQIWTPKIVAAERSNSTLDACTHAYVPMEVDERTEDTTTRAIKTAAAIERVRLHLVLMSAIASKMW
jgi:hypothetical protein